jgi:hypothetical protein
MDPALIVAIAAVVIGICALIFAVLAEGWKNRESVSVDVLRNIASVPGTGKLHSCEEAGITDKVQCEKYLAAKPIPSCGQVGITNASDCNRYQQQHTRTGKHFTCAEAGIGNEQLCLRYLTSLPIPSCAQIGLTQGCAAYESAHANSGKLSCLEAGITDALTCNRYIANQPIATCTQLGISSTTDCLNYHNRHMIK